MRAILKKINSIESLRTKLASGEDVKSLEMEQMTSRDLSQEELDEISQRSEPPSLLGFISSSSELPSPLEIIEQRQQESGRSTSHQLGCGVSRCLRFQKDRIMCKITRWLKC